MRIALVIGSLERGGAQSMVLRLLDGFERRGHDVRLICLDGNHEVPLHGSSDRVAELAGCVVHLSRADVRRGSVAKLLSFPLQWLRLYRLLHRFQSEVVVSFMERANFFNVLIPGPQCRIVSIRKHLSMAMSGKSPFKRMLVRGGYLLLRHRADVFNFNAEESARDFVRIFPVPREKVSVIYNFLDLKIMGRQAAESLPPFWEERLRERLVVMNSGRFAPEKAQEDLIRAFADLRGKHSRAALVLLGEGRLRSRLEEVVAELGLQEDVFLPGFQSNPFPWLARADMFVLSSLAEGFPNALLEAMAVGTPVVAAACPSGPVELLNGAEGLDFSVTDVAEATFGLLVPRLDRVQPKGWTGSECLVRAIDRLLGDPFLRMEYGTRARERGGSFSEERVFRSWIELVERR